VARRHLWTGVDHTSTSSNRRTVASILVGDIRRHVAWTAGSTRRLGSSALHRLGQTPALRPDPDIQAAMTVVSRLAHGEGMAAAVDRLQLLDTDPRGAFLVCADL
jgi:hypothetical protein